MPPLTGAFLPYSPAATRGCAAAAHTVPGLLTVPTKSGHGYGVLTKTPELVREEIEGMMAGEWPAIRN